jgi:hypothetical protein
MKTKVVFRKWKEGGGIIALFPEEYYCGMTCRAYDDVGKDGDANYTTVMINTMRPSPLECVALKRELERLGYDLEIYQRATPKMQETFMAARKTAQQLS